jgi:nucleotide-binding universal stress UspA family protein
MKAKPTNRPGEVVLEMNRRDEAMIASAERNFKASPFRMKRILVAIDFSDCARKALQYALPLAKEHGAAITLIYVVQTPAYPGGEFGRLDYVPMEAEMRESGKKALATLIEKEICDAVPVDSIITTGAPAHEITEAAKRIPADLIVISTHGRTGLKHVFLGSVAEMVVRHAPCPVLIVREREHEFLAET